MNPEIDITEMRLETESLVLSLFTVISKEN